MLRYAKLIASQLDFDKLPPERVQVHPRALLVVPSFIGPSDVCAAIFLALTGSSPARGITRCASGATLTVTGGSRDPLLHVMHARDVLLGMRVDTLFVWVVVGAAGSKDPALDDPWWDIAAHRLAQGGRVVVFSDQWRAFA